MRYDLWINKLILDILEERKDTIIIGDCQDVLNVVDQQESVTNVFHDIKGSYVALYFPWLKQMGGQVQVNIPPSFYVTQKQYNVDFWRPIQGINYGGIPDVVLTTKRINDSQQDYLSDNYINALRFFQFYTPAVNIFEEKTHYKKLSVLARLSQRRTSISIYQEVARAMRQFLMEPLIQSTFDQIVNVTQSIMNVYVARAQIFDYKVDLDTSVELIDNNMVLLTVSFKPMKYLEFIDLTFQVRSYQQGVGSEFQGESVT